MAATGKKSKKTKWIPASVTNFIAETTVIPATNNWADSVDEEPSSNYSSYAPSRPRQPVVLPSASRAARGDLGVDDESIPRRPPYIAHISNLPYDVDESAIMELFAGLKINNLRLPREGERLKGFGNVDFEDRESLVSAMNMPDLTVGGRRIRIEVSNQDNERRMGRNNRSDRDREYDPERTMGDWRSGPRAVPDSSNRARPMERDGMRDRDRDRDRESSADNKPGAWRDAERAEPPRQPYGGRDSYGRDRERDRGYGGRDGFRTAERDGGGFGGRESRGFGSRGFGDRDRDPPREADGKPRERPKLNLLPRTVPREVETPTKPADGAPIEIKSDKPVAKPVSAEKVFGAAKPVDTAAKEREIEERLRKQEEENRRSTEEKERWSRRNDLDDQRGRARRDDRDRGYRSYNKDRRDYSRDNKDKRDYSKDDRERSDYSRDRQDYKDDRERSDYSRDRQDYKDDRERSDYSRDRQDYKDDRPRRESYDRDRGNRAERGPRDDSGRRDVKRDDRGRRDEKYDRPDSRDGETPKREYSQDRRSPSPAREQQNGRESRSRDRHDADDRPMPKMKEQEKPNFVASNKFSFLEDAGDVSE